MVVTLAEPTMSIARIFAPDYQKYEGVRPINIYLLRTIYFLMVAYVATWAWGTILRHQGPWDPMHAVAICVWAIYPTMAILGVIHPLRMLPIMIFTVAYKLLWLTIVAYPLWRAGTLNGQAAELTNGFIGMPIAVIAIPWGYVWRTYVTGVRKPAVSSA
ncbi:MAG TPA: hypothetical protein VJ672_03945 [Gemmatimonadaceae bacterium]|nr:hypothetical protein [Gemmatimonadaceae bacterium]